MAAGEWHIPPSVLRWVLEVPQDRPVAVLIRHTVRPHLPANDVGHHVCITEDGARLSRELGGILGGRLRSLHASPVIRCVQTAEALRGGAAVDMGVVEDRLLGDPGVFVLDTRLATPIWWGRGHESTLAHFVSQNDPLPGMAAPEEAARFLVHHMLAAGASQAGFHVFVTHDSLVTITAARILGEPLGKAAWPEYLEAAFFWREGDVIHAAYRDIHRTDRRWPVCGLDECDVIELARREIAAVVGLQSPARFFLAGGAFKTLLTGRPARDLDLWAPSAADRVALLAELAQRGARPLDPRPFAQAFEVRGRVIEVALKVGPPTLEACLGRFDIALSAIGAEHLGGDQWRAIVNPHALQSVLRREVLLLKPLVNWKYALATLERMYRYAGELGYRVPDSEVDSVWDVFDSQTREMQEGMIARLDRATMTAERNGVREQALRRAC
jgi:hypothetical protein